MAHLSLSVLTCFSSSTAGNVVSMKDTLLFEDEEFIFCVTFSHQIFVFFLRLRTTIFSHVEIEPLHPGYLKKYHIVNMLCLRPKWTEITPNTKTMCVKVKPMQFKHLSMLSHRGKMARYLLGGRRQYENLGVYPSPMGFKCGIQHHLCGH